MSAQKTAPLRILLVEDEMMVSIMLEDMLEELGHIAVGPARNLQEAKRMASETSADLAILDLNLNGESSAEVAAILAGRNIPFLFATGYDRNDWATGTAGALCIQKPFEQRRLGAVIHKAMAKRAPVAKAG